MKYFHKLSALILLALPAASHAMIPAPKSPPETLPPASGSPGTTVESGDPATLPPLALTAPRRLASAPGACLDRESWYPHSPARTTLQAKHLHACSILTLMYATAPHPASLPCPVPGCKSAITITPADRQPNLTACDACQEKMSTSKCVKATCTNKAEHYIYCNKHADKLLPS